MTRIRLDYVHEYNRRGRIYRYFRRPGSKQIRLRGVPGSQEFMDAYQAALDGQTAPERQIGAKRTRPGTVNAAVVGYYTCLAFRSLAPSTQKMRRAILERFREDHGDKRIAFVLGAKQREIRSASRLRRLAAHEARGHEGNCVGVRSADLGRAGQQPLSAGQCSPRSGVAARPASQDSRFYPQALR